MKLPGFPGIVDQMRAEWNDRAMKDAHFYVAFGRESQTEEDFLASAAEVMPAFEPEFSRLRPGLAGERRALEIGCGPGRLMVPMTRHFGEVHGVDISEEMVALARQRLVNVANAQVHVTSGTDLGIFTDCYFDFVYSYIVLQHIPDKEIVLRYLREAQRVLKPGGVLCCQIRGTAPPVSEMSTESGTWTGCFFHAGEIMEFAKEQRFSLVAISGLDTQYMWTTFRKPLADAAPYLAEQMVVKDVTAASGPGSRIPNGGRDAAVSLWIDGMPDGASLADIDVWFGEQQQSGCYLSPVAESGGCQLNCRLPNGMAPGEYKVQMSVAGMRVEQASPITVVAAAPSIPRVVSVTDGINKASRYRLETDVAKVMMEDVLSPGGCSFTVAGSPVERLEYECRDTISNTWEFCFHLNPDTPSGRHWLVVSVAGKELDLIGLELLR